MINGLRTEDGWYNILRVGSYISGGTCSVTSVATTNFSGTTANLSTGINFNGAAGFTGALIGSNGLTWACSGGIILGSIS